MTPAVTIDQFMRSGVGQGVFPGAVLYASVSGTPVFEKSYGWADVFSRRVMTIDTYFDLASLTKPLATTLAIMVLVQQGKVGLDVPCAKICDELNGTDKTEMTIRQLLTHCSGLPAWRPYFMALQHLPGPKRLSALRHMVIKEPLQYPSGAQSVYSDLGFMVLHWVIERVAGVSLHKFITEYVYAPLNIRQKLFFNELPDVNDIAQKYAATQLCPWRNRLMVGEVDDDNAWITGGVAGHAGLFGTAEGVAQLLHALITADENVDDNPVFDPELVHIFLERDPKTHWALGFDTPEKEGSSAGDFFSSESIGHLGFTGTSFWVHRPKKIVVVLLTNRVHPFRFNTGIKGFRPLLHNLVMQHLAGKGTGGDLNCLTQ